MKLKYFLLFLIVPLLPAFSSLLAQEEEPINYFQMEPLDDSLFIYIQQELFIDPPDPKAEIIADVRDPNNQTISIKGVLYPFLALSPELRARVVTYPFKINLEENINFGSVFTRVVEKIKISKVADPPTKQQITSTLWYINPFFQLFGGERFGIPLKRDLGISFGIGTRYEGPLNTNALEAYFHILGAYGGAFTNIDPLINTFSTENHNNLIVTSGIQLGYVIPFGNFLEISYLSVLDDFTPDRRASYLNTARETVVLNDTGGVKYQARLLEGSYLNWEFRYPVQILGSTRGRFYVAQWADEWHLGFDFREMSLAGSTFDLMFDAMPSSKYRNPEYVINLMVQKIAESWAFSAFAIGPSMILSRTSDGGFGALKIFFNLRLKMGTSL